MREAAGYSPDLLPALEEAARAYRRRDDESFRALLEKAIACAPDRIDIRLAQANHHIQTGDAGAALLAFRRLGERAPRDVDALTFLAHWLRFGGEAGEAEDLRGRLREIRPARAADLARIWESIDSRLSRPVRDEPPRVAKEWRPAAIVVLGYALAADGAMRPPLVDRLEKTLEVHALHPSAPIVLSGGVPRSGQVEAVLMRRWLADRGVPAALLVEEGYSRDLVENIVFSRPILDRIGAGAAIIVTGAENVRRAGAAMEIHARMNGSPWLVPAAVAASGSGFGDFVDDGRDRLKLYRDALRAYGLPMLRILPELISY